MWGPIWTDWLCVGLLIRNALEDISPSDFVDAGDLGLLRWIYCLVLTVTCPELNWRSRRATKRSCNSELILARILIVCIYLVFLFGYCYCRLFSVSSVGLTHSRIQCVCRMLNITFDVRLYIEEARNNLVSSFADTELFTNLSPPSPERQGVCVYAMSICPALTVLPFANSISTVSSFLGGSG